MGYVPKVIVARSLKTRRTSMQTSSVLELDAEIDPVEEMRLRTWARQNYAPQGERDTEWHPVILEEMRRRDHEHSH